MWDIVEEPIDECDTLMCEPDDPPPWAHTIRGEARLARTAIAIAQCNFFEKLNMAHTHFLGFWRIIGNPSEHR